MPHKTPNGRFTRYTINELRAALDKLVAERPECGEWDALMECDGSDCGYVAWGGFLDAFKHPSSDIKVQRVVLEYNRFEEEPL